MFRAGERTVADERITRIQEGFQEVIADNGLGIRQYCEQCEEVREFIMCDICGAIWSDCHHYDDCGCSDEVLLEHYNQANSDSE